MAGHQSVFHKFVQFFTVASAVFGSLQESPVFAGERTYATVSGIARFERRSTLHPQICTDEGCVKPQTYWSLVLQGGGTRYELNQLFEVGNEKAPESIEVASVTIAPGARVVMEARVELINRSYSVLSDVQAVQIEDGSKPTGFRHEGTPFFGWTCKSVDEAPLLYVDVQQTARGSSYAMHIVADGGKELGFQTLASFSHVQLSMSTANIGFTGEENEVRAELDIDPAGGRGSHLVSELRLSGEVPSASLNMPIQLPVNRSVQLVCDRTR